jgi:hypothetical protein
MGWIDLRSFGLGVIDWAEGVRWAIIILLAAWLLMMVIWLPYLRATRDIAAPPSPLRSPARRVVELVYMQAHWAFYRAAMIVFLTGVLPNEIYWGSVVGLGIICLEAFLNPAIRQALLSPGTADRVVWGVGQAVINTLSFIVTRNLLLLVLIQAVLEITVPHTRPEAPQVERPRT